MTIALTTPAQMTAFGLLQLMYRLALECNTSLKFRQSTLAVVQRLAFEVDGEMVPITTKRTKKGALKDLVAAYTKYVDPNYEPSDVITKAIA